MNLEVGKILQHVSLYGSDLKLLILLFLSTLALAYFYCCSTDPCVAIFNDELHPDVERSNALSRDIQQP